MSLAEQKKTLAACARLAQACEAKRPINWLKDGKTDDHVTMLEEPGSGRSKANGMSQGVEEVKIKNV